MSKYLGQIPRRALLGAAGATGLGLAGALLAAAGLALSCDTGVSAPNAAMDAVKASANDVSMAGEKVLDESMWFSP